MDVDQVVARWNELYDAGQDRSPAVEAFKALPGGDKPKCWERLTAKGIEDMLEDIPRARAVHADLSVALLDAFYADDKALLKAEFRSAYPGDEAGLRLIESVPVNWRSQRS